MTFLENSLSTDEETQLWRLVRADKDETARSHLIEYYVPIARRIAAGLYADRPDDEVEFGDYMQYALLGLVEAVDRFDPGRGASFRTFATYRIRGAVLNGIEKATERREQSAFRHRFLKDRLDSLANADAGSQGGDLFAEMVELAVGLALGYMLEDSGLVTDSSKGAQDAPYARQAIAQMQRQVKQLVDTLPDRERRVVIYHYFYYVRFEDLAHLMGVTKGRVSQIHKRALSVLRESLQRSSQLDASY